MNAIPAVCNRCGFSFPSPFSLDSSRNSAIIGCGTNCPRCGGDARVLDSFTDSEGQLYIHDLFNFVRKLHDPKKLQELRSNLEAANDATTADEVAEALAEIEPGLEIFSGLIKSLPAHLVKFFIDNLLNIVICLITLQAYQASEKNHDEDISIQRAQLELSREQFEYEKQQNKSNQDQLIKEQADIKKKIEELQRNFEKQLAQTDTKTQEARSAGKSALKGKDRNKPCKCGSGEKAKKCHPDGL